MSLVFVSALLLASNWVIGPFQRPSDAKPVITPDKQATFTDPVSGKPVHWEALHTFNPAAVVRNGRVYVLYRAEDDSGAMMIGGHTSRLGLAVSDDGIHFQRDPEPVFFPANDGEKSREWPGGCEDPRLVESEDGTYVLTYTQWNQKTYDVGIATSPDLHHWTKHGPMLAKAYNGKYRDLKYKSAGIVTKVVDGRLKAAKINGTYWMFWGEGDIRLATSTNLLDWQPVEDQSGTPMPVLSKRDKLFDSSFPETGPPPVITDAGIVVIYNGKNAKSGGDPALAADTYSAGQALFSATVPSRILGRLDQPFFKPELPFERSGQYAAGTTFVEGLVYFQGKWLLYYGCADSLVGVAVARPNLGVPTR